MHVLIAEDDPVTRLHLSAALKGLGYEVTVAPDGKEAWTRLQTVHVPMVVSDWSMPEMEGTELCRRVRARHSEQYTYFILITSEGGKRRYLEGMEAGADDFIAKPVDLEELHARLKVAERILGLRRHVRHLEGLLPICSYCKRIRDENDEWTSVEAYIEGRSKAQFSHGICPPCYTKYIEPQLKR
jgi:DNA-binding response OmpR family regulator